MTAICGTARALFRHNGPMNREHDHRPHWTLEGCLLFTLVVGPAVALGMAFDANAGTISDWVAALATTGALVAAAIAARYAAGVLMIEQRREQRAENDRRAEQANRVAAWPDRVRTTSVTRTRSQASSSARPSAAR